MILLEYKNKCNSEFCQGDSYELFLDNCNRMPADWIWRTTKVRYTINSQGYRCAEWDNVSWSDSILFFGCSFVFGIGIDDSHTCAHQLSNLQNKPVINLGRPGTSPMFQWANTCLLAQRNIKPAAVIYLWPDTTRTACLLEDNKTQSFGIWSDRGWGRNWATHPTHGVEFLKHAITSTNGLWDCPVLHYHIDNTTVSQIPALVHLPLGAKDNARDWNGKNAHPGPITNSNWATIISNDLNGLW